MRSGFPHRHRGAGAGRCRVPRPYYRTMRGCLWYALGHSRETTGQSRGSCWDHDALTTISFTAARTFSLFVHTSFCAAKHHEPRTRTPSRMELKQLESFLDTGDYAHYSCRLLRISFGTAVWCLLTVARVPLIPILQFPRHLRVRKIQT